MKYLRKYRDFKSARRYAQTIRRLTSKPWTIMEVCGGQTHAIVRYALDELLPSQITIAHGTGCPFSMTPVGVIDKAVELSMRKDTLVCGFNDIMRVPGSETDLLSARANGGDVHIVFSPLDAVEFARTRPDTQVVFLAAGFETTAPANAMAVHMAREQGIENFSVLVSHYLVPPGMERILAERPGEVHGFLANGHACTVMGYQEYEALCTEYKVPIVVTGFEPLDILQGILMCVVQLEEGRAEVENQYARTATREGNANAREMMQEVFEVVECHWRGLGTMPESGLALREKYRSLDAEERFGVVDRSDPEDTGACIASSVLKGSAIPTDCPAFGTLCTPEHALGAPMVSSEGTCYAYFRYRRPQEKTGT